MGVGAPRHLRTGQRVADQFEDGVGHSLRSVGNQQMLTIANIEAKRTDHRPFDLVGSQRVYVDGQDVGPAHHVLVRLVPDAIRVVA